MGMGEDLEPSLGRETEMDNLLSRLSRSPGAVLRTLTHEMAMGVGRQQRETHTWGHTLSGPQSINPSEQTQLLLTDRVFSPPLELRSYSHWPHLGDDRTTTRDAEASLLF